MFFKGLHQISHTGLEITDFGQIDCNSSLNSPWLRNDAQIMTYMNCMDLSVCQPRKAVKLNYSPMWIVWVEPVPLIIFQSNSTFDEKLQYHYNDVIMGTIACQITSVTIVYSAVYSDADQRKHQSSASLAFVRGITGDRWIPAQMASNAESVSIWWRIDVCNISLWSGEYVMNRSVTKFHSPK